MKNACKAQIIWLTGKMLRAIRCFTPKQSLPPAPHQYIQLLYSERSYMLRMTGLLIAELPGRPSLKASGCRAVVDCQLAAYQGPSCDSWQPWLYLRLYESPRGAKSGLTLCGSSPLLVVDKPKRIEKKRPTAAAPRSSALGPPSRSGKEIRRESFGCA